MSTEPSSGGVTGTRVGDETGRGGEVGRYSVLPDFLDLAVPLEMQRLAEVDLKTLCQIARDMGRVIAEHGDVIQFRARGTASATASLIRGLAAAALVVDGGITFAGRHWCTDHDRCTLVAS